MLIEPLLLHAARQPRELAIIDDHGSYTYQVLGAMAAGMARRIASQTSLPRVGLLLPSSAAFVASFYGALLSGKMVVPINFLLGESEVAHCIKDSAIDTVVTIPQLAGRIEKLGLKIIDVTQNSPQNPGGPAIAEAPKPPAVVADDVAVLMYTSGTSGLPKGVPLTYGNLQSDVDGAITYANFQSRHKFLGIIPLFHAFGMTGMMLCPIQLGATMVFMARFSPVGAVNAIKTHGVSLLLGVPSMFAAIARLKNVTADDFKTIYFMISGGEPLPAILQQEFESRLGVKLLEAYGMTETSLAICLNTPQSHRAGSVGRAIPGMQIRIVDDAGKGLGIGEEGEIWLKGPMVTRGYHNLPVETRAAFAPDGYFKTGDLGKMDADGFLFITGRKKDLIIIAGEKVSPVEIEDVLMSHPEVAEAAAIGRKDPSRGEVVAAFVVPKENSAPKPEDLRAFCRQKGLAQWKIPREIRIMRELPRSATGKILKRVLAQESAS